MSDRTDFKLPRRSYSTQREVRSKIKIYPNGDKKITTFAKPLIVFENTEVFGADDEDKRKSKIDLTEEEKQKEIERVAEKRYREVREKIEDYARSNPFTHFITLTQSRKIVGNRFDDDLALSNLASFLKTVRKQAKRKNIDFKYIVVPERHKNGALHFHMLAYNYPYDFVYAKYDKRKKIDIYKIEQWKFGISHVVETYGPMWKLGVYMKKYITKQMMGQNLGKSKKKYWCSKGLRLPIIEHLDIDICKELEESWSSDDGNIKIYNLIGDEKDGKES